MMRVAWGPTDVIHTRFGYSPLVEITESLWLLHSHRATTHHQWWLRQAPERVSSTDRALLQALVPARPAMADFLFGTVERSPGNLNDQLDWISRLNGGHLHAQFKEVWTEGLPVLLADLLNSTSPGTVIAETLQRYWEATLKTHWSRIRGVLEEDIAHRAATLASDGFNTMLAGLHERIRFEHLTMSIGHGVETTETELNGSGMMLIPSVFAWPLLAFNNAQHPSLIYGARGIGRLAEHPSNPNSAALSNLLGRTRTAVLLACRVPVTTTELSVQLAQSPAAVSQHLSILREGGLLRSWRSGRRVLYLRTLLGDSIAAVQPERSNVYPGVMTPGR
jgi:DNA-binding transcriptional ArsR family regulator